MNMNSRELYRGYQQVNRPFEVPVRNIGGGGVGSQCDSSYSPPGSGASRQSYPQGLGGLAGCLRYVVRFFQFPGRRALPALLVGLLLLAAAATPAAATVITAAPSRATIQSGESGVVSLTIRPQPDRLKGYVRIRPDDKAAAQTAGISLTGDNGGRWGFPCAWNDTYGVAIGHGRTCHVDYNWLANTGQDDAVVLQFVEYTNDHNRDDVAISDVATLDLLRLDALATSATATVVTATPASATIRSGESGRVSLTITPQTNRLKGYMRIRPDDEAAAQVADISLTGDNGGRFGEACGWNDPQGVSIGHGRTCHVDYTWPANTGQDDAVVLQFVEFTADDHQNEQAISDIATLDLLRLASESEVVQADDTGPQAQGVDPFCRDSNDDNPSGTITMKATGGWPGGAFNERARISGGIEIEVDICDMGARIGETEIDLSLEGTGICVDHLKIDGWTRKDLPGQRVRWCGLVADGGGVKPGWTVEGNKSGKPDVYATHAKGRITFRGTVRAYDDGVVRGDRTLGSVRAYFNRAVGVNDSGGHAQGDYGFVNSLPNRTVRDKDAATVSLVRRFVYGGDHHGWNYVVDVDTPIVNRGNSPTSTPEYWTMAITAGGKGFWVRVPSGRTFSGWSFHTVLPLAGLRANMGGTVRTMKEWCGRSESERGNMQYASVKVQGIAGPDASQISFSELAAGTDLCNP